MQEVKVITVRGDNIKFQSDINNALANGWQLGQLSTCVNGGAVLFTMVMTKETAEVGAGSPNVGSVNRESLQFAEKVDHPINGNGGLNISQYDMH